MFRRALSRAFGAASCRALHVSRAAPVAGRALRATLGAGVFTTGAGLFAIAQAAPNDIPAGGIPGTRYERTFLAIKPDGVQRRIVGEIISRFEKKGFRLVAMKTVWPTKEFAAGHYDDLKGLKFFPGLVKYFSSGPVVAMCWEGVGVIKTGRKMLGATKPQDSNPGTIRGDLCINVGRNICHGSDCPEAAISEISYWFKDEELYTFDHSDDKWINE